MGVTLDQMLMLAGRLDDAPGFDAPRERFRRFLLDHVRDSEIARGLIEQCQYAPGEQHRRALQDLIVLLGRFIGFQVTFGSHLPIAAGLTYHGHWRSRSRLHVIVEVRSDETHSTNLDSLLRSVTALAATPLPAGAQPAGLSVVTPLHMTLDKVEESVVAAQPVFPVGIVTLGTLISLADMVSAGPVTHDHVVRLLRSNVPLDFIVDLLKRCSDGHRAEPSATAEPPSVPISEEPSFWIVTVAPDHGTRAEELLERVVGKRHVFGITDDGPAGSAARVDDQLCFYISGTGIVGHARVASLADRGIGIRDAHRFRQLLQLDDLKLHLGAPIAPDAETELRLHTVAVSAPRHAQTLVRISRDTFNTLTTPPTRGSRDPSVVWTETNPDRAAASDRP